MQLICNCQLIYAHIHHNIFYFKLFFKYSYQSWVYCSNGSVLNTHNLQIEWIVLLYGNMWINLHVQTQLFEMKTSSIYNNTRTNGGDDNNNVPALNTRGSVRGRA